MVISDEVLATWRDIEDTPDVATVEDAEPDEGLQYVPLADEVFDPYEHRERVPITSQTCKVGRTPAGDQAPDLKTVGYATWHAEIAKLRGSQRDSRPLQGSPFDKPSDKLSAAQQEALRAASFNGSRVVGRGRPRVA